MTQKDKKQKGQRDNFAGHKTVQITEIIKLDYIVKVTCWCGTLYIIDSSKDITENVCPTCHSPCKLLPIEWTHEELHKIELMIGQGAK